MNTRKRVITGLILGALASSPVAVMSHGKAKGIVLERHTAMTKIKKAGKSIGEMVRGKRSLDRNEMAAQAAVMSEEAKQVLVLFPDTPESRKGPGNNTKATVWSQKQRFDAIGQDLVKAADGLSSIAATATNKEIKAQYRQIQATCKSCHKTFRTKKKH